MSPETLNAWLMLFASAEQIGSVVAASVRAIAHKELSKEDLEAVLAQWEDNVRRASANAGLPEN